MHDVHVIRRAMSPDEPPLALGPGRVAYIRQIGPDDLPEELQARAREAGSLYGVHTADGLRLAIVRSRAAAFAVARQHDLIPVATH